MAFASECAYMNDYVFAHRRNLILVCFTGCAFRTIYPSGLGIINGKSMLSGGNDDAPIWIRTGIRVFCALFAQRQK